MVSFFLNPARTFANTFNHFANKKVWVIKFKMVSFNVSFFKAYSSVWLERTPDKRKDGSSSLLKLKKINGQYSQQRISV